MARSSRAQQIDCLARTIYFEARGETLQGQIAVGQVVMNRVADPQFPDDVCAVVRQGGEALNRCQFTWWCDGRSDSPEDLASWKRIQRLARQIYDGGIADPTRRALWYHAVSVAPGWKRAMAPGRRIGRHVFYPRAEQFAAAGASDRDRGGPVAAIVRSSQLARVAAPGMILRWPSVAR